MLTGVLDLPTSISFYLTYTPAPLGSRTANDIFSTIPSSLLSSIFPGNKILHRPFASSWSVLQPLLHVLRVLRLRWQLETQSEQQARQKLSRSLSCLCAYTSVWLPPVYPQCDERQETIACTQKQCACLYLLQLFFHTSLFIA